MTDDDIIGYWCNPFTATGPGKFTDSDMYSDKMPIVFMGGRGTGKTMFLKYFSYSVQRKSAIAKRSGDETADGKAILEHLTQQGGVGFYIRIDGPVLRSFEGQSLLQDRWDVLFTHFFELKICEAYLVILKDLADSGALKTDALSKNFLPAARQIIGSRKTPRTLDELIGSIHAELDAVTEFRAKLALSHIDFSRPRIFAAQHLSVGIWECIRSTMPFARSLNFVVMIDEYENFRKEQQRIVNTLIKFVRPGLTFRLGMRLEGFHSYDTTTEKEFIKEGRDYRKIVFEDILQKDARYRGFLRSVAQKRLESVEIFEQRGLTDIVSFLSGREDLECEAKDLVLGRKNNTVHFGLLKTLGIRDSVCDEAITLLRSSDNPLLEMLAIVWVLRGVSPQDTKAAMDDYLQGRATAAARKFGYDYINKYKLSLMILLASLYRDHKKYYSFNTYCFLSSGIVGNFIEICRRAFQIAYFEKRSDLVDHGRIAPDIQDRASRELSVDELQLVPRIHKSGDDLYHLVVNLGNIFKAYHLDYYMTYPETNQFSVDVASIKDVDIKEAFRSAMEWSIIQRKPQIQSVSARSSRKVLYTLNRVFAPQFDITYRTRGGYSEEYSAEELKVLMRQENVPPQAKFRRPITIDAGQRTFDFSIPESNEKADSISPDISE